MVFNWLEKHKKQIFLKSHKIAIVIFVFLPATSVSEMGQAFQTMSEIKDSLVNIKSIQFAILSINISEFCLNLKVNLMPHLHESSALCILQWPTMRT